MGGDSAVWHLSRRAATHIDLYKRSYSSTYASAHGASGENVNAVGCLFEWDSGGTHPEEKM